MASRLLALLPPRLTRRGPVWRDHDGWVLDLEHRDDPRTPDRLESGRPGPWRDTAGQPAHGIYHRPAVDGLTDWAAGVNGWMTWRWTGPRMLWRSELVSPWNPILAQSLHLDELSWSTPDLDDPELWTAEALTAGWKTGGYFGLPRRQMRTWSTAAEAAGLVVHLHRRGRWGFAAQPGRLGDRFDLDGLAAEYRRVLPADLGEQAAAALAEHAQTELVTAGECHEEVPEVVCGLALGYPPEVTAGMLLRRAEHDRHRGYPAFAEYGAYCRHCDPSYQR